jgi:peptidoglycan/xylan/chitin deacetylase (PgdA/CDA1 family)
MKRSIRIFLLLNLMVCAANAQMGRPWNGRMCAVVLTYDDGLNVHLENAIPALDTVALKATFYISDYSGALQAHIPRWRHAAASGHELANHSIYHPCEGGRPGRTFVKPAYDLNNYTVQRMVDETRTMNTLLTAIDGKTKRTFAYPCGDMKIRDTAYIELLKNNFAAARGVVPAIQPAGKVDLYNVGSYPVSGQSGAELIALVKKAEATGGLLVFLFHGVGGGHNLDVSLSAHRELLHYLKSREKDIWIAPMLEVAEFIKARQKK